MGKASRDRFRSVARFESSDLVMLGTLNRSFWPETLIRWQGEEGVPPEIFQGVVRSMLGMSCDEIDDHFGFERTRFTEEIGSYLEWIQELSSGEWNEDVIKAIPVDQALLLIQGGAGGTVPVWPRFEEQVLAEDERTTTVTDWSGITKKMLKGTSVMPSFIDFPVKDRATWNEYKKRLDPTSPERWPPDWQAYVASVNGCPDLVGVYAGSLFGFLREWMGLEGLLYAFYDDPAWVEEMMDHCLYFTTTILERALADIRVDVAAIFEDMCYKSGPMISPDMFRRFMMPRYKKITELLRSHGVEVIIVDTDGNPTQLVPLWIESGINATWPLEAAAGCDPVAIRKEYGHDFIVMGTIDKRALAKGPEAIREEVMGKVPFLLESGGYFPSPDHMVPPDVSFANYCCYVDTVREVAGLERLFG